MAKNPEITRWWTAEHGRTLRQARLARGLTQKEAAAELKVTDDTIRHWEAADTQPRDEHISALARFRGVSMEELHGVKPAPSTEILAQPATSSVGSDLVAEPEPHGGGIIRITVAVGALLCIAAVVWLVALWPGARFDSLRAIPNGIEAVDRTGAVRWRALGISSAVAQRSALVRIPSRRAPVLACVLTKPYDFQLESVQTLSFVDTEANRLDVIDRVLLPTMAQYFPGYSRRYEVSAINAVDLNGDNIDEVIITYQQVPECVSYSVLYEPRQRRHRVIFAQTGGHHFAGAFDLDQDGRRDLLFLGINNGYNWMNSLAAIRVEPWIDNSFRGDEIYQFSPDAVQYVPNERGLIFYALLPRGRVPNDPKAVSWDPRRRQLTVRLMSAPVTTLTARGFLTADRSSLAETEREALRREAYRRNREARRLRFGERFRDALTEARNAVTVAARSGDRRLLEAMQRDLGKLLIAAGRPEEGALLLQRLSAVSENASEIHYDTAVAFHLRGDLSRAVAYYESGIGRGGSPEAGKSKHEFIQGEVLALVEAKAWADAYSAIARFRARYVTEENDWTAMYGEFVRWQSGEMPRIDRILMPHNATDLLRYWMLEFRNARGDSPSTLLRDVDALISERNQPRGAILSLRAVLLDRVGRRDEAVVAIQQANLLGAEEMKWSIIARGHQQAIVQRRAVLTRSSGR